MKKLLIIFLLLSATSYSQPFKPGYYPKDTVITVEAVRWQSLKSGNRTAAPKSGTYWQLVDKALTLEERVKKLEQFTPNPSFKLKDLGVSFFSMTDTTGVSVSSTDKRIYFFIQDGNIVIKARE